MLEVRVRKSFANFFLDVDLVLRGGFFVLLGKSGNGKSLLLKSIAGFIKLDSGFIKIQDKILQNSDICLKPEEREIAFVMQESFLFPHLSVLKNMLYGNKKFDKVFFDKLINILELEKLLERKIDRLSGGEKQRVCIARALLTNPRILLMDEPISSIDETQKGKILVYLKELHSKFKIPILYVTHSLYEAEFLADEIGIIEKGKIVQYGAKEKVIYTNEIFSYSKSFVNLLNGIVIESDKNTKTTVVDVMGKKIHIPFKNKIVGENVCFGISADQILISKSKISEIGASNIYCGKVKRFIRKNATTKIIILDCGFDLIIEISQNELKDISHIKMGDDIKYIFRVGAILVF